MLLISIFTVDNFVKKQLWRSGRGRRGGLSPRPVDERATSGHNVGVSSVEERLDKPLEATAVAINLPRQWTSVALVPLVPQISEVRQEQHA